MPTIRVRAAKTMRRKPYRTGGSDVEAVFAGLCEQNPLQSRFGARGGVERRIDVVLQGFTPSHAAIANASTSSAQVFAKIT